MEQMKVYLNDLGWHGLFLIFRVSKHFIIFNVWKISKAKSRFFRLGSGPLNISLSWIELTTWCLARTGVLQGWTLAETSRDFFASKLLGLVDLDIYILIYYIILYILYDIYIYYMIHIYVLYDIYLYYIIWYIYILYANQRVGVPPVSPHRPRDHLLSPFVARSATAQSRHNLALQSCSETGVTAHHLEPKVTGASGVNSTRLPSSPTNRRGQTTRHFTSGVGFTYIILYIQNHINI